MGGTKEGGWELRRCRVVDTACSWSEPDLFRLRPGIQYFQIPRTWL